MKIIKRDGREAEFDPGRIAKAISAANSAVAASARVRDDMVLALANEVADEVSNGDSVDDIQRKVIDELYSRGYRPIASAYQAYADEHTRAREARARRNTTDGRILSLLDFDNEEVKQENANKNPSVNSVQRDYMAGEVSKDITKRFLLPQNIVEAHEKGIIHFHDMDYFAQHMHNCCLVNLEDMFQNGTMISGTRIETPKSFFTACNVATQIVASVASSQYGGQTITLSHLAPFVDVSRRKLKARLGEELEGLGIQEERLDAVVEQELRKEIQAGIQTIQYQFLTLMTTNGQTPFISVAMYLGEVPEGRTRDDLALIIEETLRQRILGIKNEAGAYITPAFPKLLYVLEEENIREDGKYRHLTRLAAECTAKRMVPDYISAKIMRKLKGDVYPCMGCRSFLTPDNGHKYYGRFNQGVVTVNLPHVALSSGGDEGRFWEILEERLELCHKALRCKHERLLGTPSDVAPILWQHGALARLGKGEKIDRLLYGSYSTISLGYAGLYECVRYMTGRSHTDPEGKPFALSVMRALNDACARWRAEEDISYSLYGTPMESTTYKFAKANRRDFGTIPGVTEKNYITNSYHVHVTEEIDAFTKLGFESEFQALSPGGAISYVEVPDLKGNIEAVLAVVRYIYDNIMYAELNTKSDYCQECGYDGEILIVDDDGKLVWECPNCGNRNPGTMNIARRTCGYIGTMGFNQGRTEEIRERVLHL